MDDMKRSQTVTYDKAARKRQGSPHTPRSYDSDLDSSSTASHLFVWGGLPGGDQPKPQAVDKLTNKRFRQISFGPRSVSVVSEEGSLWSMGSNEEGQLGEEDVDLKYFKRMENDVHVVMETSASEDHSAQVLQNGCVLTCGTNEFGQLGHGKPTLNRVPVERMQNVTDAVQVACGAGFTLVLTRRGELLSCGNNAGGCLGRGAHVEACDEATAVEAFVGVPLYEIGSSDLHCGAISQCGDVYTWGRGTEGQLGHGEDVVDTLFHPRKVEGIDSLAKSMSLGSRHTVVLLVHGVIVVFGHNSCGQLGHNPRLRPNIWSPSKLPLRINPKPKNVACGAEHTLIRLASGQVLGMGRNEEGQLGGVSKQPVWEPIPITFQKGKVYFYTIAAGADMSGGACISIGDLPMNKKLTITIPFSRSSSDSGRQPKLSRASSSILGVNLLVRDRITSTHLPIGISIEEAHSLLAETANRNSDLNIRLRMNTVFADIMSLSCSFRYPGRRAIIDFEEMDKFYTGYQALSSYESLGRDLCKHINVMLRYIIPHARYFLTPAQFTGILIVMSCPALSFDASTMDMLLEFMFKLSTSGKGVFHDLIVDVIPPSILRTRIVKSVVTYLDQQIHKHLNAFRQKDCIWIGVLFLQLVYHADTTYSETRKEGEVALRGRKVPHEEYTLSGMNDERIIMWELTQYHMEQYKRFTPSEARRIHEIDPSWRNFLCHSNLCPVTFKRDAIKSEASILQQRVVVGSLFSNQVPFLVVHVRRDHLVDDALSVFLHCAKHEFLKPLRIVFDGEPGVDEGGPRREFFALVVEKLFNPNYGMFIYNDTSRTAWFNGNSFESADEYSLIGVVIGLAVYNDVLLNLHFPLALYKKMLGVPLGLEDLHDVFPEIARSLQQMLDMEDPQVFQEAFQDMTFEISYDYFGETKTEELFSGGKDVPIEMDSRAEYVRLYVEYLLSVKIRENYDAFMGGFGICQTTMILSLTPLELKQLVCGTTELHLDEMRKQATYEGYADSEPYIDGFWAILDEFSQTEKQQFLTFATGGDLVPLEGLGSLLLRIHKNGGEPTQRLPTAYTCFNVLLLPRYSSIDKLRRLLKYAISNTEGFGLN